jgi:hypothetical protein
MNGPKFFELRLSEMPGRGVNRPGDLRNKELASAAEPRNLTNTLHSIL